MKDVRGYLICSNPKCATPMYPARWHQEGKARKVGKRHYCGESCKTEHVQALKNNEREQK